MGASYPIEVLTPAEVGRLMRVVGRGASAPRNRALIVVMWRGGLRVAEALAIAPRDIDLARGTIRVRHGKGDVARTVALDPDACDELDTWRRLRVSTLGPLRKRGTPFFCTLTGGPMRTSYVRQLLPRLARRAGVAKRVHAHALRHTFAVELARERVPLHVISAALGHANVATTSRYIAHVELPELVDAMRARPSWRGPIEGDKATTPTRPPPEGPDARTSTTDSGASGPDRTRRPPSGRA